MDKSSKLYKLAMDKYQDGYIDDALEYCEKSISFNIKNSAALNLKGLLLYIKGELDSARNIWRLNKDINKDQVSKKYIESSQSDEERKNLYDTALGLMREIRIKEALELLEKCKESDYNAINVGNALSSCLIRQGEYQKAIGYIDKVMSLDKKNKTALENRNMLIQYGVIKRNINYKRISIWIGLIIILSSVLFLTLRNKDMIISKLNSSKQIVLNEENVQKETAQKEEAKIEQPQEKEVEKATEKQGQIVENKDLTQKTAPVFPMDNIKAALDGKNYEELYKYYKEWKDKATSVNEKSIMATVEEVLRKEGTTFFYSTGNQVKEQDVNKALENLKKAYEIGKGSYLYQHIVFLLGHSYEKIGDQENALRLYEEYYTSYPQGDYGDEVLNSLVMIYKNIDINKAKKYASELVNRYPKSIYNNSKLKQIIESK